MSFLALAAAITGMACQWSGVQMSTLAMSGCASNSRKSTYAAQPFAAPDDYAFADGSARVDVDVRPKLSRGADMGLRAHAAPRRRALGAKVRHDLSKGRMHVGDENRRPRNLAERFGGDDRAGRRAAQTRQAVGVIDERDFALGGHFEHRGPGDLDSRVAHDKATDKRRQPFEADRHKLYPPWSEPQAGRSISPAEFRLITGNANPGGDLRQDR